MSMAALKRLTHASILAAGMILFGDGLLYAADQTVTPMVSEEPVVPIIQSGVTIQAIGGETATYETNPLMLLSGAKSLSGFITSPELIFNDQTPLSQLNIDNLINENLFDQTSFDSTDLHSAIKFTTQNQRWSAGVQEKTDYDTTRTSELSTYGVISTAPVRHLGVSLAPQVSFSPNSTDKYSVLVTAAGAQYATSAFQNYETGSITPSYAHNFDPRNTGTFSLQAQTYRTTSGISNKTDSVGPSIGWITELAPRLTGKATVGVQATKQTQGGPTPTSSPWILDYIYSLDIGFKGQQDIADIVSSRSEYPFGDGTEALLTSLAVTESHALNPRFSLNAGVTYLSGTYQTTTNGSLQSALTGNAGLTYHATDHLDATAAYQYRYETLTNTSGNAEDNMFTVGVVYHPQAWGL